jgi:hypothetical protein
MIAVLRGKLGNERQERGDEGEATTSGHGFPEVV